MKKTISTILILCMALTSMIGIFAFPTSAAAVTADPNWYVAGATTLEIKDEADLMAFAEKLAATGSGESFFKNITISVTNDIELNENWDGSTNITNVTWTWPNMSANVKFEGIFNGNGHTISGIYQRQTTNDKGLFGSTGAANTEFNDFTIARSYIYNSGWRAPGMIGHHGTGTLTFDKVNVESNVTYWSTKDKSAFYVGNAGAGGVLTFENCIFKGNVVGNKADQAEGYVAAFCGYISCQVVIENCAMYGNISNNIMATNTYSCGGIIGQPKNTVTINNVIIGGNIQANVGSTATKTRYIAIVEGNRVTATNVIIIQDDPNVAYSKYENITDYKEVTSAEMTGIAAQATLDEVGVTGFAASAIGLPVLKGTVVTNEVADAATKYEGYQTRFNDNGTMDVRLVGSIHADIEDIKKYEAVGFTVVAYYQNDAAAKVQAKELAKTQVYTSVIADGVEWTPAETLEDTYLFVHGFKGIATDKGPVVFEITTFYTDANGATVVGGTNTVTVPASAN